MNNKFYCYKINLKKNLDSSDTFTFNGTHFNKTND